MNPVRGLLHSKRNKNVKNWALKTKLIDIAYTSKTSLVDLGGLNMNEKVPIPFASVCLYRKVNMRHMQDQALSLVYWSGEERRLMLFFLENVYQILSANIQEKIQENI